MYRKFFYGLAVLVLVLGLAQKSWAMDTATEKLIKRLEEKGVLSKEEINAIREEDKKAGSLRQDVNLNPNVNFFGDFRYRYEFIDDVAVKGNEENNRDRHRMRLRLGADVKISDTVNVRARLATSERGTNGGDPVSTNESFSNGFSEKEIFLDQAFVDYHPVAGLNLYGGKMANPFVNVGGAQLVWDSDLNPEGLAARYTTSFGKIEPFAALGYLQVQERATSHDTTVQAGQAGLRFNLSDDRNTYLTVGGSIYDYSKVKGRTPLYNTTNSLGNTTTGSGTTLAYASDFSEVEGFVELGARVADIPVALFGDIVNNRDAASDNTGRKYDQGWLVGLNVGRCREANTWAFRYNYRELEKDCVIGQSTYSDPFGGGTNGKGHEVGLNYQITNNVQAGLTYFFNKKPLKNGGTPQSDYQRVQMDLMYSF